MTRITNNEIEKISKHREVELYPGCQRYSRSLAARSVRASSAGRLPGFAAQFCRPQRQKKKPLAPRVRELKIRRAIVFLMNFEVFGNVVIHYIFSHLD